MVSVRHRLCKKLEQLLRGPSTLGFPGTRHPPPCKGGEGGTDKHSDLELALQRVSRRVNQRDHVLLLEDLSLNRRVSVYDIRWARAAEFTATETNGGCLAVIETKGGWLASR